MHDSPLCYCPVAREWIELDGMFAQCREAHGCAAEHCPLQALFRQPPPGDPLPAGWNDRCLAGIVEA